MRSIKRTCDSTATPTYSGWIRLSPYSYDFNVGFVASPHNGTTGTYSVQATESNPEEFLACQYTRVTTTLTINYPEAHGLSVADGVILRGSPWDTTNGQSIQVASVVDADTITIAVADTGPAAGVVDVNSLVIVDLSSYSAVSARQQGTVVGSTQMVRVAKASGTLAGKVTLTVTQSGF